MSGNLALVVDRAGATLEKGTHDTVVLTHADGQRERVGLRALGSVVLHGDVKLSTGLLQALAAHDVAVTTLPVRGRNAAVGFTQMPHQHVQLRHQQHLAYADTNVRLNLARCVVFAKINSMTATARQHAPELENELYRAMQAAVNATNFSALMGVEGAATVKHFAVLETLYRRSGIFTFNGRSRRPPRDPVNALMSLSYTLAQGHAMLITQQAGLDIQLGFLHSLQRDRESLALDLIEPARAVLDEWIHKVLIHQGLLKPTSFTHSEQEGVRLNSEGRTLFYSAWYSEGHRLALTPMQQLLSNLLEQLRSVRH